MHVVLVQTELVQGRARGDLHLRADQVDVGDLFGHRVLDLDARIHLDEDVLARTLPHRVEQELDGARVDVADGLGKGDGIPVHGLPDVLVEVRRRSDLDDLLVAALHRAVALEEVNGLPRAVREDLHLDVARPQHGLLEEHGGVAEGAVGFAHGRLERLAEVFLLLDASHPAPATARDGLREDREADRVGTGEQLLEVA